LSFNESLELLRRYWYSFVYTVTSDIFSVFVYVLCKKTVNTATSAFLTHRIIDRSLSFLINDTLRFIVRKRSKSSVVSLLSNR
jgi:hypothetical protein